MWQLSPPIYSICMCVLCEMVVKIVEMHLPLGCFVDFLWLRPGRNASHAAVSSVHSDRDSNSNSDIDRDSCLYPLRGATMLFAVSQISQRLLECHRYFPFVFCLIFLCFALSLSLYLYDCHVCGSCGFTLYTFKPNDVRAFLPLPQTYLELSVMRSLGIPAVGN